MTSLLFQSSAKELVRRRTQRFRKKICVLYKKMWIELYYTNVFALNVVL